MYRKKKIIVKNFHKKNILMEKKNLTKKKSIQKKFWSKKFSPQKKISIKKRLLIKKFRQKICWGLILRVPQLKSFWYKILK